MEKLVSPVAVVLLLLASNVRPLQRHSQKCIVNLHFSSTLRREVPNDGTCGYSRHDIRQQPAPVALCLRLQSCYGGVYLISIGKAEVASVSMRHHTGSTGLTPGLHGTFNTTAS